ncbi:peroxiredoxin [Dyella marensis]|uniref:thioredoxin-dependent peroxiredoxin n=1 Tax=Dyella marensis TaxID=500610 RepID=A0A1I2K3K7_9GAMM|nr:MULTISPECIES: peroxiredoxin [Dyella]SFF60918.1 peroxiredoxin Q/BCP [Dyella marensis]
MRRNFLLFALTLLVGLAAPAFAADAPASALPQVGQSAPDFRLQDQNGKWHTPADFRGHWLVLYFYPKDFTPGCTTQVCTFRDDVAKLRKAGAMVVGVSLDDVKSHADFAAKYHVPFPLLADSDKQVATAYGVLTSKMGMHYAKRTTFLIDPEGKVAKVYQDVDPEKNSAQVQSDLTTLKSSDKASS